MLSVETAGQDGRQYSYQNDQNILGPEAAVHLLFQAPGSSQKFQQLQTAERRVSKIEFRCIYSVSPLTIVSVSVGLTGHIIKTPPNYKTAL